MSDKNKPIRESSLLASAPSGDTEYRAPCRVTNPSDRVSVLRAAIREGHTQAQVHLAASLLVAIQTGEKLREVKALLPHGAFLSWIDSELTPVCNLSRRSAQRYMQMSERRQELVERIREEYSTEPGTELSFEAAESILSTLRINDAGRLLPGKKRKPVEKKPQPPEQSGDTASEPTGRERPTGDGKVQLPKKLIESVIVFFRSIASNPTDETNANTDATSITTYQIAANRFCEEQVWRGQVFVHPPDDDSVGDCVVRATVQFSTESIDEALLLLPDVSGAEWLQTVDRYPRVYVRNAEVSKRLPYPTLIVALTNRDRYRHLQAAFSPLGQLFVPYSYPKED